MRRGAAGLSRYAPKIRDAGFPALILLEAPHDNAASGGGSGGLQLLVVSEARGVGVRCWLPLRICVRILFGEEVGTELGWGWYVAWEVGLDSGLWTNGLGVAFVGAADGVTGVGLVPAAWREARGSRRRLPPTCTKYS